MTTSTSDDTKDRNLITIVKTWKKQLKTNHELSRSWGYHAFSRDD